METQASRQWVLDYCRALQSDPSALAKILADDVVWSPPRSAPVDGPFRGRDRFSKARKEAGARFFDLAGMQVTTKKVVADGDTVVVLQSLAGKALNGRDYSNGYVWVFTCANGKIVRMDEHTDTLRFQRIVMDG